MPEKLRRVSFMALEGGRGTSVTSRPRWDMLPAYSVLVTRG